MIGGGDGGGGRQAWNRSSEKRERGQRGCAEGHVGTAEGDIPGGRCFSREKKVRSFPGPGEDFGMFLGNLFLVRFPLDNFFKVWNGA